MLMHDLFIATTLLMLVYRNGNTAITGNANTSDPAIVKDSESLYVHTF